MRPRASAFGSCTAVSALCLTSFTAIAGQSALVAGADMGFPPFEYRGPDGRAVGFTVDLLRAIAAEAGLDVRHVSAPWADMVEALTTGEIDILPMFISHERHKQFDFTEPFTITYHVVFARGGAPWVASPVDLRGARVIVQKGSFAHDHLVYSGIEAELTLVPTEADAMVLLASGGHDFALITDIGGRLAMAEHGISGLVVSSPPMLPREYAFAVRHGRDDLLNALNRGLAAVRASGEFDKLHEKWFDRLAPPLSLKRILGYGAAIAGPPILLALVAFAWSWSLRRTVGLRTSELMQSEERLSHTNAVLRGIRNVNQLITREKDRQKLIQQTCELLVEARGFSAAFIVLLDKDGPYVAGSGLPELFAAYKAMIDRDETPACGHAAIEREGVHVFRNPKTSCPECSSAAACPDEDDAIATALRSDGRVFGFMSAAVPRGMSDDREEHALFEEVAGDVAFALRTIEIEAERERAEHAVRANERLLAIAGRIARLGGWSVELSTNRVVWSDELSAILEMPAGHSPTIEEALAFYVPELRDRVAATMTACATEGVPFDEEWQAATSSGRRIWVRVTGEAERDSVGSIVRIRGAFQDITDRVASEEAIRESEERHRLYLEHAPYAFFVADDKAHFVQVNEAACRITGYERDELLSMDIPQILDPDSIAAGMEAFRRVASEGSASCEVSFLRKDGVARTWSVAAVKLSSTRLAGFCEDITERKATEAALMESESQFRAVYEDSPVSILIHDKDTGQVIDANDSAVKMYGFETLQQLQESGIWMDPPYSPNEALKLIQAAATEGIQHFEWCSRRADGELFWEMVHLNRVTIGGIDRVVATAVDITEQKREAAERESLQEQLIQSQKMEAVGRLAGGVAHDFNNMLGAIIGYTDIIMAGLKDDNPLREDIRQIRLAADRSAGLTRQLLAFSRKQVLQPKVFDLDALVTDAQKMLIRLIGEDIRFDVASGGGRKPVKADPGQIEQVLMNLVVNARKAMPEGGSLMIETAAVQLDENYIALHPGVKPGRYAMLAVTDTGCGMDSATLSRIFEPFFTTRGKGLGTGLGLATAYGILNQSGGHIWAYSEVGRGTTFKAYLPLVDEPVEIDHRVRGEPSVPQTGTETVLVVEDEPALRSLVTRMLAMLKYDVLAASNPGQALSLMEETGRPVHLLLTDVVMPEMGGRQLAEKVLQQRPDMKVLYMSGYTDNAIVHHGVLDAGTPFIQKPFTASALAAKVREVLSGSADA